MSLKMTNNELTNFVCDFYEDQGNFDWDFDKIESTIENLDDDLREELQEAVERGNEARIKEIVEDY